MITQSLAAKSYSKEERNLFFGASAKWNQAYIEKLKKKKLLTEGNKEYLNNGIAEGKRSFWHAGLWAITSGAALGSLSVLAYKYPTETHNAAIKYSYISPFAFYGLMRICTDNVARMFKIEKKLQCMNKASKIIEDSEE